MGEKVRDARKPKQELENLIEVNFSHAINESELHDLMKYIVLQFYKTSEEARISLNLQKNIHYEAIGSLTGNNIDAINTRAGDLKGAGQIIRWTNLSEIVTSASFRLKNTYDELDRPCFTGIDFNITPGYEPGELTTDDTKIMKLVGNYVRQYFELSGRQLS